ncbi:MAG: M6 family metalloprotease domain-containing protein [Muribaculaceae bacterium]|nr:M6 family metalloprotease domain-containing protein [Muribaculaceae bacterium]
MTKFSTRLSTVLTAAFAVVALGIPGMLRAVPAFPGIIMAEQPDGTTVPVRMVGDERGHRVMTTDGHLLLEDASGFLTYAEADTRGLPMASSMRVTAPESRGAAEIQYLSTLRKPNVTAAFDAVERMAATAREAGQARRYLCSGASFPASNSPAALVVLVEFSDKSFSMDNPHDFYTRLLNEKGFSDYNATGSARDFFIENSSGVFTPDFDVFGPVQLQHPMRHYGANNAWGQDVAPEEIVIEACRELDGKIDFSKYDTNSDGQIDNVFIFYAGYGEADSNQANTIWPHSADILDFALGEDYYFDGKLLNRYGMTNEIDYVARRPDGIGTFVHEFSHVMGLPDLYDTLYGSSFTPGHYSTMDMGPYNNSGRTPPHFSSFERYCLDWLTPEPLTAAGEYELEALHISNKAYLIATEKPDEFFLLENRQQECCDAYIPGHGMLVWHIDYVEKPWNDNIVNNIPSHQYVDLVEADDKRLEADRDGDLFPGTRNVREFSEKTSPALLSWNGNKLGILGLTDISEENGVIRFKAISDTSTTVETIATDASITTDGDMILNSTDAPAGVYNLSGAKIAEIPAGGSLTLDAGLYIVSNASGRLKVRIK